MKNKSLLFGLWLIAMTVGGFGLSFTSAETFFHLDLTEWKIKAASAKNITDNMMYVHFADNENDFGGFLYISNWSWDEGDKPQYEIRTQNSISYGCRKKIKWFYYNAERWERLWPLDDETWKDVLAPKLVETEWWIFADCVGSWYLTALNKCDDGDSNMPYNECVAKAKTDHRALWFGYYGSISHTYKWKKFNLTLWVDYEVPNEDSKFITIKENSELAPTFERLDNQVPIWFVYDYNWWLWLAWCRFNNHDKYSMRTLFREYKEKQGLSEIFTRIDDEVVKYNWDYLNPLDIDCKPISVADTLLRIVIEWIVWMNEGWDDWNTKYWPVGNSSDKKMQYFGTKSVNTSTLMNYAIKKAELLCRWKWTNNELVFSSDFKDKLICWNGGDVNSDRAWQLRKDWKTLVSKWWSVTVVPDTWRNIDGYYDIYLLEWNLLINESAVVDDEGRFVFNTGGFVSNTLVLDFSGDVYNAICPAGSSVCDWIYNWNDAAVWSFIKWNFIINGKVKWSDTSEKLKNKYFVYGKFTTKEDTFNSLEKTFSWTCENWFGSDGNYCPQHPGHKNPYWNAALVVIDQNYGSPLLR